MRSHWWSTGSVDGLPAMQVVGDWYITNITGDPVYILGARIVRPRRARTDGFVMVCHPERDVYGTYAILPGATTDARVSFWVKPPIRKEGQDFKATIIFIDQFGNEHKIKEVIFKGPKPNVPKKVEPTGELIHAISDPIEKEIVAVLKDELNRYRMCGRRVGGLGSVQTTYKGQKMRGVGTGSREADSPKNQAIVPDPETVLIESDNATALLNLYQRLRDDGGVMRLNDHDLLLHY